MPKFDVIDGGIPAAFADGPKKGHVGVVNMDREGAPPPSLTFLTDLVYVRAKRGKVKALDAYQQPVKYDGVIYRVDTTCGFMVRMRQEVDQALVENGFKPGEVETQ